MSEPVRGGTAPFSVSLPSRTIPRSATWPCSTRPGSSSWCSPRHPRHARGPPERTTTASTIWRSPCPTAPSSRTGPSTSRLSASTTPASCWKAVTLRCSYAPPTASPSNWWRPKSSAPLHEPAASSLQRDARRGLLGCLHPIGPEPCHEGIGVRKDKLPVGIHDVEVDGAAVGRDREFDLAVDDEAPERSGTRRRHRLQAPSRPESEQLLEIARRQASARFHAQLHMFALVLLGQHRAPERRLSPERPTGVGSVAARRRRRQAG